MKDLNKVQQALEQKCKSEIREAKLKIYSILKDLEEKYNSTSYYHIEQASPFYENEKTETTLSNLSEFTLKIEETLIKKHLDKMLELKSKELLSKLELI